MQNAPIIIQGAMASETDYLISLLKGCEKILVGHYPFYKGELDGVPVVVSRTLIGMVNATAATVLGLTHFAPRAVLNQGTCGGHDPNLHKGDIVIGKRYYNAASVNTAFVSQGGGVNLATWQIRKVEAVVDDAVCEVPYFSPDPAFYAAALAAAPFYKHGRAVEGVISSADIWNREIDRINWAYQNYQSSAEEMEIAAVAQICDTFHVPVLGVRILSNNEILGEDFDESTGVLCQEFCRHILAQYTSPKEGL